jgi:hypothetical protein
LKNRRIKNVKQNDETTTYAKMGMAAMLPGMAHMVSLMQRALDEMREALGQAQGAPRKLGRPRKDTLSEARAEASRSGWPSDPEERSREMKRQQAVAARNKTHKELAKKKSVAAKKRWSNMSERQKKARLKAMLAGRKAKKAEANPVRLAVAS